MVGVGGIAILPRSLAPRTRRRVLLRRPAVPGPRGQSRLTQTALHYGEFAFNGGNGKKGVA